MRKFIQRVLNNYNTPTQEAIIYTLAFLSTIVGAVIVYYLVQALIWLLYAMIVYPTQTITVCLVMIAVMVVGDRLIQKYKTKSGI